MKVIANPLHLLGLLLLLLPVFAAVAALAVVEVAACPHHRPHLLPPTPPLPLLLLLALLLVSRLVLLLHCVWSPAQVLLLQWCRLVACPAAAGWIATYEPSC